MQPSHLSETSNPPGVPDNAAVNPLADLRPRQGRLLPLRTLAEARLVLATAPELVSVFVACVPARATSSVIKYDSSFPPHIFANSCGYIVWHM